ncbi:endonuclease/exonuclease/phosphatase family protein [Flavivirga spongiicola]|uniref:Endonuclease/exonuclease/phosphatase family protein n=1 Tax=Flavivirga spongiicola TaxID=421621 RepID=A0ABU7XR22_9FLAO|nr:endonuclease/exonuclease/phosphatase family protein [Flavivirga sp. MEBiC05379]MDO5978234.1 endonuclease/exonuclease/phosphatase family protein [Flavivirga sp. MEBiC05379]
MKNNLFKVTLLVLLVISSAETVLGQEFKVIAYNVEFGKNTSPKAISKLLKPENADIICFNEVPAQGWTKKVGKLLGLPYSYEGEIASANHTDKFIDKTKKYYGKYKSILSKYPLENTHEVLLEGIGWSPASAVVANVVIDNNNSIQIFSLHIPSGKSNPIKSKAEYLSRLIENNYNTSDMMILAGDFNDLYNSKVLSYLYHIGFYNSWKALDINLKDKTTYIYPESPDDTVIDHIFFKGLKVKRAEIIEEKEKPQSDHKPIWSVFELQQ